MKPEPLLRMPNGSYASRDGRFYFDRIGHSRDTSAYNWRVIDAIHRKSVEFCAYALTDAKVWMQRRRKARP
jgi:hypothetical protein